MSSANSGLVVPVAIWGSSAPSHKITCLLHIPQHQLIVSGSQSGQIVVWSVNKDMHIHPRFMLFGHTDKVLCMADVSETSETHYVISSSEKELCLWNVLEGTCVELVHSPLVHTYFQRVMTLNGRHAHPRLLCAGRYQDLVLLDPFTLEVSMALQSRAQPDWCCSFTVASPEENSREQLVIAVTRLGLVKRWSLPTSGLAAGIGSTVQTVWETESTQLRGADDLRSVALCPFERRIVLVVALRRILVLDASDLTQLCVHDAPQGASWVGADFTAADRCAAWASNGHAYLLQLPANANPDSISYRQLSLSSLSLYTILKDDQDASARSSQLQVSEEVELEPVFVFEAKSDGHGARRASSALLLRGDVHGRLNRWHLPAEVLFPAPQPPARGLSQTAQRAEPSLIVTLRTQPRVPLVGSDRHASLTAVWQRYRPAGIIDHLANASAVTPSERPHEPSEVDTRRSRSSSCASTSLNPALHDGPQPPKVERHRERLLVTTSVYLPHIAQLVLGRSDGSIVVTSLLHALEREMMQDGDDGVSESAVSGSVSCARWPCNDCLLIGDAHAKAVTCFFYPAAAAPGRFETYTLLSGGADFSVVLWDVRGFVKQAQFVAHGGPVSRFLVAPGTVGGRLATCVASVALDNSVLLISVRERRLLLAATPHCAAVVALKWRALEGLLFVQTADGAVYVWDIQAAALDRVLHGAVAQDALDAADYFEQLVANDHQRATATVSAQPGASTNAVNGATDSSLLANISFMQALKRKNLQLVKNVAQQRIQTLQSQITAATAPQDSLALLPGGAGGSQSLFNLADVKSQSIAVHGLRASPFDPEFHVAYFDVEAVIVQLLTDEVLLTDAQPSDEPALITSSTTPAATANTTSPSALNRATSAPGTRPASIGTNGVAERERPHGGSVHHKQHSFFHFGHHHREGKEKRKATSPPVSPTSGNGHSRKSGSSKRNARTHDDVDLTSAATVKRMNSRTELTDPQIALYLQRTRAGSGSGIPVGSFDLRRVDSLSTTDHPLRSALNVNSRSNTAANLYKSVDLHGVNIGTNGGTSPTDDDEAIEKNVFEIARLIVALLHVRGLDASLDELVEKRLQLAKPRLRRLAFGHVSNERCLCLFLPGWWNALPAVPSASSVTTLPPPPPSPPPRNRNGLNGDYQEWLTREFETISLARWQLASTITTQHLLSILAITNTMISLARCRFTAGAPNDEDGEAAFAGDTEMDEVARGERKAWSVLAAYHCALLPEEVAKRGTYKAPNLGVLIQRWQDRCMEIRAASQTLVLNELGRIGPEGRRRESERWLLFVPAYITNQLGSSAPQQPPAEMDLQFDEKCDPALFTRQCASNAAEKRRRSATSIVMLGVLGAQFGSEVEQVRVLLGSAGCTLEVPGAPRPLSQNTSHPLNAVICRALMYILLQTASRPAFSSLRKCAVDLLGRGFAHFEQFVDASCILFSLLELASLFDESLLAPFVQTGLPLLPAADLCRTARHSLVLVALAKPIVFIIILAKEVARFNTLQLSQTSSAASAAQSVANSGLQTLGSALGTISATPQTTAVAAPGATSDASSAAAAAIAIGNTNPYLATLLRPIAKRVVLRLIQRLIERLPAEMYNLLIETIDIVLFAVEPNTLKSASLVEVFPALERFTRSLACCSHSRRLAVGNRQGQLAVYSLNRQLKIQAVAAHTGAVSALAFSADGGRLLATYSHMDNKVIVWQCPMPTLFGMSQSHLKCVKTFHVAPINLDAAVRNQLTSLPGPVAQSLTSNRVPLSQLANDAQLLLHVRLARLLWLDTRTVSLATSDGHEHKLRL